MAERLEPEAVPADEKVEAAPVVKTALETSVITAKEAKEAKAAADEARRTAWIALDLAQKDFDRADAAQVEAAKVYLVALKNIEGYL